MLSSKIFKLCLISILAGIFIFLLYQRHDESGALVKNIKTNTLYVFYSPLCSHCQDASHFLKKASLPDINIEYVDVTTKHGKNTLFEFATSLNINPNELSVPLFIYKNDFRIGFKSDETTGTELLLWLHKHNNQIFKRPTTITIPWFGEISPEHFSLPILTIILGLADGFNPCAMWVLVYLISIITGLRDKAKIWWLVGIFVLSSGIFYFLFMTAWLNLFLYIGYIDILTWLVGLTALGLGVNQLYQLIEARGAVTCDVGSPTSHQATMNRIKNIVSSPVNLASIGAMIALAFAVNSIEFICSSALPAIYTHMLSLMPISKATYYFYISLYVFFFMLDDLIIFSIAAFTVQKFIDTRYAVYSRFIGGLILVALGVWMLK